MYHPVKVEIPEKYHALLKKAVATGKAFSIKIDLQKEGDMIVLLTRGQINRLQMARSMGKKVMSIRLSKRQAQKNLKHEGGFFATLAKILLQYLPKIATTVLPQILGGLASAGMSSVLEKKGNGIFFDKNGVTGQVRLIEGGGIYLSPYPHTFGRGLHVKEDETIISGEGILLGPNSPFKNIPFLNILL